MNRIRRFPKEQGFTSGEKMLAVMIFAGVCGLWAGSNLSTPSEAAGLSAAAAAVLPAKVQPKQVRLTAPPTLEEHPWVFVQQPNGRTARDDPPIRTF